ncbi:MAG: hypothetical protein QOF76_5090 [Solirubrobacteraceae bacterium]|nr:hypothetical protein [Solirubrobacteraceae bacterium]
MPTSSGAMVPRKVGTLLILIFATWSTTATAAVPTLSAARHTVRASQIVLLQGTANPGDICRLAVDSADARFAVPAPSFSIRGRVSPRARPGRHAVSLLCGDGRARAIISVASGGGREPRGPLISGSLRVIAAAQPAAPNTPEGSPVSPPLASASLAQVSVLADALLSHPNPTPFPRDVVPASTAAQAWWHRNQATIEGVFRNGQCTDWAEQRRSDIVQDGFMRRYDAEGESAITMSWDARTWPANAQAAGVGVGHVPSVGAVMVFQPGAYGAGAAGHVAVVEVVAADGSFAVSNMHAPNVGEVTEQAYSAQQAATMVTDPGIAFIA